MRWNCVLGATSLVAAALMFTITARAVGDADGGASPPAQNPPPAQADQPAPPAQADQPTSQPGGSGEQRILQASGRITAIDTTAQTITVKSGLFSKTMKVGSDAQIAVEGKTGAALGDLKVGDRVQVSYQKQGDALIAQRIALTESKESKSATHPSAN